MEDYKANSHKSKEGVVEKKVEKAISGTARVKKKSEARKFTDVFISEDVGNVKSYVLMEVLVPAIKKAVSDIVVNGIDMILYGETGHTRRGTTASKVSYRGYYDNKSNAQQARKPPRNRSGYDYDDVIIDNRGEAEDVLSRMDELIDQYQVVSVADFYDLVDVKSNYTDNKYGWTDIGNARVERVSGGGYMIKLPRAVPLN